MKFRILSFLLCLTSIQAAEYALPAASAIDWSQTGVTGGTAQYIGSRTTLLNVVTTYGADNTGATDCSAEIQAAVDAATAGQVVYLPAGTYRLDNSVSMGYKDDITVRGAGTDLTIVNHYYDSGASFAFGGGANYLWNYPALAITGDPAKGATVLSAADTTDITEGMICVIDLENSLDYSLTAALPLVIDTASYTRNRKAMHKVVSKTSTTITITPPLAFPLPASLTPKISIASLQIERCGIEDMRINGTDSTHPSLLYFEQALDCWVKNVELRYSNNYSLYVSRSMRCSIEDVLIADSQGGGSSHSGLMCDDISFCRVENTIAARFELNVMLNGSTGNVFGYNFFGEAVYNAFNVNHRSHNSFNLYEGNIIQSVQSDGYHGSSSQDVGFRNWFTGDATMGNGTVTNQGYSVVLNRLSRNYCFVGNRIGQVGDGAAYTYSFGNPNMGNSSYTGTATPSTGDVWETITTAEYPWTPPGTRAATTFQEKDLDVEPSTLRVHNWSSFGGAIISGEELTPGDTLPNSLYLSTAPDYMTGYTWPPIHPDTNPTTAVIPATVRYFSLTEPPPSSTAVSISGNATVGGTLSIGN